MALAVAVGGIWPNPVAQASAQSPFFDEGQGSRRRTVIAWDTFWTYSAHNDVAAAISLTPDNQGGVYFADPFLLQVHHVDAGGRLAWSWGREGEGPGELRALRSLALDNDGNVVLVDSSNRRIVALGADGRLLREVPLLIDAGGVLGHVVLDSGQYLIYTGAADHPWRLVDQEGMEVRRVAAPASFGRFSVLQVAGRVVHWREERWAFAFQIGNGWFTFDADTQLLSSPFVEHTDFSRERDRMGDDVIPSSMSLSVRGDTLAVLFGGGPL